MTPRRGTHTDNLNNVIQVIQLGRKTGLLTVQKEAGPASEEGEITFFRGQISQARLGHLRDQQAISLLATWKSCFFTFVPFDTDRVTGPQTTVTNPSLPALRQLSPNQAPPYTGGSGPLPRYAPSTSGQLAPQRIHEMNDSLRLIEQSGLSRNHRRLLLLIDGNRNSAELARLMGRSQDETQQFIRDLEYIGIVR